MEELYRRVSDRQTMGSVVQELAARWPNPRRRSTCSSATRRARAAASGAGPAIAMRGVLSVLGLDQAAHAVLRMRDDVDHLVAHARRPVRADAAAHSTRLATNLGALGFLIDMLNLQPAMAKTLFAFDRRVGRAACRGGDARPRVGLAADGPHAARAADAGRAAPDRAGAVAGDRGLASRSAAGGGARTSSIACRTRRWSPTSRCWPRPCSRSRRARSAITDAERAGRARGAGAGDDRLRADARPPALLDEAPRGDAPAPLLSAEPTPAGQTGLEEDAEMRDIFLEEAREVMPTASRAGGAGRRPRRRRPK